MRKVVLQMMTTLNGRLDDPMAWMGGVIDSQYREIHRIQAAFDTVLVGRTTYEEMAAYWPRALATGEGTETNQLMARRMDPYRKLVVSGSGNGTLPEWNNTERLVIRSDEELAACITMLKARPGRDIHLAGGASLAQTAAGLGLVDEYQFFVYPVVSPGASWFAMSADTQKLELIDTSTYENGVVRLHYVPVEPTNDRRRESFSELLT